MKLIYAMGVTLMAAGLLGCERNRPYVGTDDTGDPVVRDEGVAEEQRAAEGMFDTDEKRNSYVKEAQTRLERLDERIGEFRDRLEEAKGDVRSQLNQAISDLEARRERVNELISRLQNSAGAQWNETRQELDRAIDRLEQLYNEYRPRFN